MNNSPEVQFSSLGGKTKKYNLLNIGRDPKCACAAHGPMENFIIFSPVFLFCARLIVNVERTDSVSMFYLCSVDEM